MGFEKQGLLLIGSGPLLFVKSRKAGGLYKQAACLSCNILKIIR